MANKTFVEMVSKLHYEYGIYKNTMETNNRFAAEIAKMVEEMLPIVSKPEFDFADDYGAGKYAGEKAMLREIKRRLGV